MSFFAGLASGIKQAQELKRDREKRQQQQKLIDVQMDLLKTKSNAAKQKLLVKQKELEMLDFLKGFSPGGTTGATGSTGLNIPMESIAPASVQQNIISGRPDTPQINFGTAMGDSFTEGIAKKQMPNAIMSDLDLKNAPANDQQSTPIGESFNQQQSQPQPQQNQEQQLNSLVTNSLQSLSGTLRLRELLLKNPALNGLIIKQFGKDFTKAKIERGFIAADGTPEMQLRTEGGEIIARFPQFQRLGTTSIEDSTGKTSLGFFKPGTGQQTGTPIQTGLADRERVQELRDGKTFSVLRNKTTGERIEGSEDVLVKKQALAEGAQLAQLSTRASSGILTDITNKILKSDGKGGVENTILAQAVSLAPDLSARLGFKLAKDVKGLALSILRPLSGAAIPIDEIITELEQIIPGFFTTGEEQVKTLLNLGDFIDEIHDRAGAQPVFAKKAIQQAIDNIKTSGNKKPSLNLGKNNNQNETIIDVGDL